MAAAAAPPTVQLAQGGRAVLPVVVAPGASETVRGLAAGLADYLGRISGARFEIATGDGRPGLALGTAADFPALKLAQGLSGDGFGADEQYLLRSHARGLYAVGATETAAQHAAWDLLGRLGCRWFFPGDVWEVVPETADLKLAVDAHEQPDYAYRSIWYGSGMWDYNVEPLRLWRIRNRAVSLFELRTGHAYDGIIRHYKDEFQAHPEYLGLLGGQRKSSKFCVANPGLRALAVRYAREYFRENPAAQCVSIEPSDGGGWCECDKCAALGSPSDRALTLANEISDMLERELPDKYVAMYAYGQHSPPPAIEARPRVIVNCATAFIRGGLTVEQMIAGWKEKGVRQFGIREYYSVNTWSRDMPHAARGGDLEYLARTIPRFHALGARFLSAESGDCWGPNGLGYYLATRMMWDVSEASRVESLVDDFLDKAFGPARTPMAAFYRLLNGPETPRMSHDLLGRMYRLLAEAAKLAPDQRIRTRIDHLALYTRYVELFRAYQQATKGEQRQAAFEQLLRHAYRMRTTMMVHTKSLYRDLPERDRTVTVPPEARWSVPEPKNPWKSSQPWSREELDRMVADGIAAHRVAEFTAAHYGRALVPAARLAAADRRRLDDPGRGRGQQVFFTWFDKAPGTLTLKVTGGLIAHYRDRGNVRCELFALADGRERSVDQQATVPPDGKPREVILRTDAAGLHKLVVNDGGDMTQIDWPEGLARTVEVSQDSTPAHSGRRSGYFYVPRGTRAVAGFAADDRRATIRDAADQVAFRFAELDGPDHFAVAVPPGQDGRFWSFRDLPDRLILLTVPPYTARHPRELLLPKEVVESDSRQP